MGSVLSRPWGQGGPLFQALQNCPPAFFPVHLILERRSRGCCPQGLSPQRNVWAGAPETLRPTLRWSVEAATAAMWGAEQPAPGGLRSVAARRGPGGGGVRGCGQRLHPVLGSGLAAGC